MAGKVGGFELCETGFCILKVLIVVNSLTTGGAGRQATALAGYLARHGDTVSVVPVNGSAGKNAYPFPPEVSLRYLSDWQEQETSQNLVGRLLNFLRMRRLLVEHRPDVIVALLPYGVSLAVVSAVGLKIPVLACERNYPAARIQRDSNPIRRMALAGVYRFIFRQAQAVTAQTEEAAGWLAQHTGVRTIETIPNGVRWPLPESSADFEPSDILKEGQKLLLGVGRLVREKRFSLLVQALCENIQAMRDWHLVILGSGPEQEAIQQLIPAEMQDRIHLPGALGNLARWYEAADVFVLASEYEGYPNVLLEAMSYGVACISFDIKSGPSLIIKNGTNGLLLKDDNHLSALKSALLQLAQDESLRQKLGTAALDVRTSHEPEKFLNRWRDLVQWLATRGQQVGTVQNQTKS